MPKADKKAPVEGNGRSIACVRCQENKKKCDRLEPCNNCTRASVSCVYRTPRRRGPKAGEVKRLRTEVSKLKYSKDLSSAKLAISSEETSIQYTILDHEGQLYYPKELELYRQIESTYTGEFAHSATGLSIPECKRLICTTFSRGHQLGNPVPHDIFLNACCGNLGPNRTYAAAVVELMCLAHGARHVSMAAFADDIVKQSWELVPHAIKEVSNVALCMLLMMMETCMCLTQTSHEQCFPLMNAAKSICMKMAPVREDLLCHCRILLRGMPLLPHCKFSWGSLKDILSEPAFSFGYAYENETFEGRWFYRCWDIVMECALFLHVCSPTVLKKVIGKLRAKLVTLESVLVSGKLPPDSTFLFQVMLFGIRAWMYDRNGDHVMAQEQATVLVCAAYGKCKRLWHPMYWVFLRYCADILQKAGNQEIFDKCLYIINHGVLRVFALPGETAYSSFPDYPEIKPPTAGKANEKFAGFCLTLPPESIEAVVNESISGANSGTEMNGGGSAYELSGAESATCHDDVAEEAVEHDGDVTNDLTAQLLGTVTSDVLAQSVEQGGITAIDTEDFAGITYEFESALEGIPDLDPSSGYSMNLEVSETM